MWVLFKLTFLHDLRVKLCVSEWSSCTLSFYSIFHILHFSGSSIVALNHVIMHLKHNSVWKFFILNFIYSMHRENCTKEGCQEVSKTFQPVLDSVWNASYIPLCETSDAPQFRAAGLFHASVSVRTNLEMNELEMEPVYLALEVTHHHKCTGM
jgi:hypothetical protein